MRTTLLGGLLDAARHNLARGAERVALFESGRAYLREPAPAEGGPLAGPLPGRPRGARPRAPPAGCASRSGRCASRRWGGRRAGRGLLRAQGRPRGAFRATRRRRPSSLPADSPSCTRAGRRSLRSVAPRPAGWASSTHRSRPRGTSRGRGVRARPGAAARGLTRRGRALRGRHQLPGRAPGPCGRRRRGRPGRGRSQAAVLAGGGELLRGRPRSSTSTAATRSARGARAWRSASSSGRPTGPSPTRRSPSAARRSRRTWRRLGGTLRE